jgi:hypothetical protein
MEEEAVGRVLGVFTKNWDKEKEREREREGEK